jgi:hypothetical protein
MEESKQTNILVCISTLITVSNMLVVDLFWSHPVDNIAPLTVYIFYVEQACML